MTAEPEDGAYVAVQLPHTVWVFRRDDAHAEGGGDGQPERHWVLVRSRLHDFEDGSDRTWAQVCRLGPLAQVGTFVDRTPPPGNCSG